MCESNRSAVIVGAEQEDNRSSAIFADVQVCKLSLVLEQSPVAIVIANLAGEIEYVNSALQRNSGYHQDELIGPQPRMRLCRGGLRLNASTDQASGHARSLLSLPESARLGSVDAQAAECHPFGPGCPSQIQPHDQTASRSDEESSQPSSAPTSMPSGWRCRTFASGTSSAHSFCLSSG
jgi:hypothetical protein